MIRKIGVILLGLVFLGSMAWTPVFDPVQAEVRKPTADADYARTKLSKGGIFKASYTSEPDAVPVNRLISWKLKVETPDGRAVKDAEITLSGDMPEHGHGLPTQPRVTKNNNDGTYVVEGIKFSMTGWWTMTFTIKANGKTDSVTFNLQLK
ncbi:MAG: FixH family protein [Nitrospirae bacterium]|nr:FixH family protein [Nitrospirota bacterium]